MVIIHAKITLSHHKYNERNMIYKYNSHDDTFERQSYSPALQRRKWQDSKQFNGTKYVHNGAKQRDSYFKNRQHSENNDLFFLNDKFPSVLTVMFLEWIKNKMTSYEFKNRFNNNRKYWNTAQRSRKFI